MQCEKIASRIRMVNGDSIDTDDTSCHPKRNTNDDGLRSRIWGPNTWNNPTEDDIEILKKYLITCSAEAYGQWEMGDSGTLHYQFCMRYQNAIRFGTLKTRFPSVHWEKSRNWNATRLYCTKEKSRVNRPPLEHPSQEVDPSKKFGSERDVYYHVLSQTRHNWIEDMRSRRYMHYLNTGQDEQAEAYAKMLVTTDTMSQDEINGWIESGAPSSSSCPSSEHKTNA